MAQAIVNAQLADSWEAYSAGTAPADFVHPKALQVLAEIGISHSGEPKHVDRFRQTDFDLVITVCDSAAEECPVWLGPGKRTHIGFPDPAQARGTQEEILAAFRQTRDDIQDKVLSHLKST